MTQPSPDAATIGTVTVRPPVGLAPMAGYTSLPMRLLARRAGAGLVYTEMLSAEALTRKPDYRATHLVFSPAEQPLAVQLFGADPGRLAEAAAMAAAAGAAIIDLNLGCPSPRIMRSGAGAALAAQPQRAAECLAAIVGAVDLPVTAKLRAGAHAGDRSFVDLARRLQDAGAAAVCLHARTVEQQFTGRADWSAISELVEAVDVPVFGNGDVRTPEDALQMLARTGCAGVLVGRAAIGDPWLFARVAAHLHGSPGPAEPTAQERIAVVLWYASVLRTAYGAQRAQRLARTQLLPFVRGMPGARKLRSSIATASDFSALFRAVLDYWSAYRKGRIDGCPVC